MENDLTKELSELKLTQNFLNKAIQRKRADIFAAEDEYELMRSDNSPRPLSDSDLDTLETVMQRESQAGGSDVED